MDEARASWEQISLLGLQLFLPDVMQNRLAFEWILKLKRAAAYDIYYIALAQTLGCEMWTADSQLFNAAQAAQSTRAHWVEEINNPK